MDAQQICDEQRLLNRRACALARLRNAERKLLGDRLRASTAVIEQYIEKGLIDDEGAAAWRLAVMTTIERETAIIDEQYKME
jgi:uncharacterized protein YqeY